MNRTVPPYQRWDQNRLGLRRFREPVGGAPRLLGFPFAGGQSLAFRPLADRLPGDWGVAAIDPPGHGWTAGPPLDEIDRLAELCARHLPAEIWEGAVLYGHSMGGCLAWRLATMVAGPMALVLGATRPPHMNDQYGSFLLLSDAELLELLAQLGGVPADWAERPDLFAPFREALRADFLAFERFSASGPAPRLPVLAIGATLDRVCRPEHIGEWSRHAEELTVEFLSADHLFLQTHAELLAARLVRFVSSLSGATDSVSA